jgi:Tol biopolymer transport system component
MPIPPRPKLILPLVLILAALALPATAGATLAYVKNPFHSAIFVAADDGSGARKVGNGDSPHVAPDGETVVYRHEGPKHIPELKLVPMDGGPTRTLMKGWRESGYLAFSPDGGTIAALRGPELGKVKLVLIDVANGRQAVVVSGFFSGFGFSPDGTEIAYARAGGEGYPSKSDVFRFEVPVPGKVYVRPPEPVRLTRDHRSSNPLWGPTGRIVFVKTVDARKRRYAAKNELYLMSADGRGVKRLTHTKVPELLQGLFPTAWSDDGSRLLVEFQGQDTSYAVTVNPRTGAQRPVAEAGEQGFVGTDISADGKLVLGYTGGFEPGPQHDVVAVPYGGGKPKVLAKGAFEPDWSR